MLKLNQIMVKKKFICCIYVIVYEYINIYRKHFIFLFSHTKCERIDRKGYQHACELFNRHQS